MNLSLLFPDDEDDDDEGSRRRVLSRPYGVAAILSCYDREYEKCRLFRVDNTGYSAECTYATLGSLTTASKDGKRCKDLYLIQYYSMVV